jgi:GntR family transcriptional regulator/MocR family aminotransferase
MFIRIDPRQRQPLQLQIYESVRRAILGGVVAPGARLPSSRVLADELGVSRLTAVLAFEQLAAEGYTTSRAGAGTFVNRELPDTGAVGPASAAAAVPQHPQLSHRGLHLSQTPRVVRKIDGPPRAFRIGTPALDRFPVTLWNRLVSRHTRRLTAPQLDYGDAAGLPALREAIAAHVSGSRGTSCTADQVIVVAGAQQGLDMLSRLLLDPGETALLEEPGYPGARAALTAAGARIEPMPVDEQGLIVEHSALCSSTARLVFTTPSHQFPLGVPMSLPRRLALLRWARDAQAWVVEDDYDSEFRYGARAIPCLHGLDTDGRVIYVGSFSKTLFPGLRLGYLIVPPDLHGPLVKARLASDIHPQSFLQGVVADLIGEGHFERHVRRMSIEYRARLTALEEGVRRYCHGALELRLVATGLHAAAELLIGDDAMVSREALAHGIETMPLSAYYAIRSASSTNGLLLGFGSVPPRVVTESVKRLAAVIEIATARLPQRSASIAAPAIAP